MGASSALLLILNIIHVMLGLFLTGVSIWFFVEVQSITSLRNSNHYLLDYNVYWPQAIPWMFMLAGVFVVCISCCGFVGAKKKRSSYVTMYIIFEVIAIVGLIAAAVVAFTLADTKATDQFIQDTIWDVFTQMNSDRQVTTAFGNMEKRLSCCGAAEPRDYINRRREFPPSCCDTNYHGLYGQYAINCDFTNKMANERHGCTEVVTNYARIVIKFFTWAAVFTAFIGVINVVVAVLLSKSLKKKKPRVMQAQNEFESKKVLL